jgi:flavin-dependent dehydrogenase
VLAARLARSGVSVLLVEASAFDDQRVGEFLAPEARALINGIGILDEGWERRHQPISEFVSTWGGFEPAERNYIFNPHGDGLALDRSLFDRELAAAATKSGAFLLTRSYVRAATQTYGGWEIAIENHAQSFTVQSKFLAACCGRSEASFPGLPRTRRKIDKLICLGLRLQNYGGDVRPTTEAYSRGWAYSVGLASGELVINLFTEGSQLQRPSLDQLLRELAECPLAASRIAASKVTKASQVAFFRTDASSICSRPAAGVGWCLAGDAAQSLDPLSSGGILQAVRHAVLVSDSLLRSASFRDVDWSEYGSHLDESYSTYQSNRRHVYGMEQRWPTPFWLKRTSPAVDNNSIK